MFIPPYPPRPQHRLALGELFHHGRRDMLSIWSEQDFHDPVVLRRFLGRRIAVLNDPAMFRQVLVSQADYYRKSRIVQNALRPLLGRGSLIAEGRPWRLRRRAMAPLFHPQRLPGFLAMVGEVSNAVMADWSATKPLDVHWEMTRLSAEVASRGFLGDSLHQVIGDAFQAFDHYQDNLGRFDLLGLLGAPTWLPSPGRRRGKRAAAAIHRLLAHTGHEEGIDCPALDRLFHDAADPERALQEERAVLFLAGHETTASVLAWGLYLLAKQPESAARVAAEGAHLAGQSIDLASLEHLPYTRAVVTETLRLYPPVPVMSREPLPRHTNGNLPRHSLAVICPWVIHRHHRYWEEPDAFYPERFLGDGSVTRLPNAPVADTLIPFSLGPRACPGAAFGYSEATLALALILARWQFTVLDEPSPVARLSLRPVGLRLQAKAR